MKKILIFTLPTGNGHNQVAKVLKKILSTEDIEIKIINPLDEASIFSKTIIQKGYLFTASNVPVIYCNLYKYSNSINLPNSIVDFYHKKIHFSLLKEILSELPDMVISTHPILNQSLSKIKNSVKYSLVSIVTDFRAHKIYVADNVDIYVTSSTETKEDLSQKGINPDIIHPYGIPISEEFLAPPKKTNKVLKRNNKLNILIMGGSLGIGIKKKDLIKIIENVPNCKYTIVCGTNIRLYENLKKLITKKHLEMITLYKFTDKIPHLMESSDLIISKPGGITLTEAILKNLPIIIPYTIPGQEEENAAFVEKHNLGKLAFSRKKIIKLLKYFIENRSEIEALKKNSLSFSKNYLLEKTKKLLINLLYMEDKKIKQPNQESSLETAACG